MISLKRLETIQQIAGLFIVLLAVLLFGSCDESSKSMVDISAKDFTKAVADSAILVVENEGDLIQFTYNVKLTEGECDLLLINPLLDTVFSENIKSPKTVGDKFEYERTVGVWVLKYTIKPVGKIQPSGSYDFQLFYFD